MPDDNRIDMPDEKSTQKMLSAKDRFICGSVLPSIVSALALLFSGLVIFSGDPHVDSWARMGVLIMTPIFFGVSVLVDLWVLAAHPTTRRRAFALGMAVPGSGLAIAIVSMLIDKYG